MIIDRKPDFITSPFSALTNRCDVRLETERFTRRSSWLRNENCWRSHKLFFVAYSRPWKCVVRRKKMFYCSSSAENTFFITLISATTNEYTCVNMVGLRNCFVPCKIVWRAGTAADWFFLFGKWMGRYQSRVITFATFVNRERFSEQAPLQIFLICRRRLTNYNCCPIFWNELILTQVTGWLITNNFKNNWNVACRCRIRLKQFAN